MIVDFHAHTFPEKVAPSALRRLEAVSNNPAFTNGTTGALQDCMHLSGVTHTVLLPVVTNPEKANHINDVSIAHDSSDGLIYFGGIHPDTSYWYAELARVKEAGLPGIKLHPPQQGTDIDDIRYIRILERCGELGLVVVIHAGVDMGFLSPDRCTPKKIRSALDQAGPVKLVAAHMGGLLCWDTVPEYLLDTSVYIDTSYALGKIAQMETHCYDDAQLQLLNDEQFCHLIELFGKERVLFGTDSPWNRQVYARRQIDSLPLDADTRDHIYYKNACKLLNLKED